MLAPSAPACSHAGFVLTCKVLPPGVATDDPANLLLQPGVTLRTNYPFKAKSFNAVQPINDTVLAIVQRAVLADSRGWVQFSAYGVKALPWRTCNAPAAP